MGLSAAPKINADTACKRQNDPQPSNDRPAFPGRSATRALVPGLHQTPRRKNRPSEPAAARLRILFAVVQKIQKTISTNVDRETFTRKKLGKGHSQIYKSTCFFFHYLKNEL